MRNDELFIEFPQTLVPRAVNEGLVTPLPGRIAVLMEPDRDAFGVIQLPDELAGRTKPDCGTINSVWDPYKDQNGNWVISPLMPGEKVLVRPYHGLWWDVDGQEVRFYGVSTAWYNSIIARYSEELNCWIPMPTWFCLKRKSNGITDSGIYIPNSGSKRKCAECEVILSSSENMVPTGSIALVDPNQNKGYRCRFSDELKDCEFIQDYDYDGKISGQRLVQNIWAIL